MIGDPYHRQLVRLCRAVRLAGRLPPAVRDLATRDGGGLVLARRLYVTAVRLPGRRALIATARQDDHHGDRDLALVLDEGRSSASRPPILVNLPFRARLR